MKNVKLLFVFMLSFCCCFDNFIIHAEETKENVISSHAVAIIMNNDDYNKSNDKFNIVVEDDDVLLTRTIKNAEKNNWRKDCIVLFPKEGKTIDDIVDYLSVVDNRYSGNNHAEDEDPTLSVRLYSTFYFNKKTIDGGEHILLTSASGGIVYLDTSVYVSYQEVDIGCTGSPYPGQHIVRYPTSTSWSYSTPSSWNYIPIAFASDVGVSYEVTIQRVSGGNPWTFTLINNF